MKASRALQLRSSRRLRSRSSPSVRYTVVGHTGSNDLTQLTLGIDRDSELLAGLFNERDEAVKWMIRKVIQDAHKAGVKIGLCGQAPSDHADFAEFLVECGIDSISVTPDSFIAVKQHVAEAESRRH